MVILILLITYRSPILWILPIFCALVALAASNALIYVLAKHAGLTVNGQSAFILTVLVIGAGTDYALLLVARYREELRVHEDRHEAMAVALHRAAPAIIASAMTVAIGMLCLTLAEMNSTAGLGPVLAIGVVVTLVVMVTLLPALLVVCGRWVFWPKRPTFGSAEPTNAGIWARVGKSIARRPRKVWIVTVLLLGIACLGLFKLDASGLTSDDTFTHEVESVTGLQMLADHGLTDTSSPVMVVANADQADAVAAAMKTVDGIGDLYPSPPPKDGLVLISAPIVADASSPAAFDTVVDVRDAVHAVPDADALVGGSSAIYYDIQQASHRDDLVIAPVVLLVVLLILMLLLRALLAPLILIATVVLSFGVALGISALIFTQIYGFPTTDSGFPLFAFVFLVALGHRLQHLPDDQGPRGDRPPRHPPGIAGRPRDDRWRDHVGGAGAGGDVRDARHAAARVRGRDRDRRGDRRPARHPDRAVGAGHRDQPRPGRQDLVAEQARPRPGRPAAGAHRRRTCRSRLA